MNGLLVVTGIILLVCMIKGLSTGIIKIAASLAATGVMIVFVVCVSPYVSDWMIKVTLLESFAAHIIGFLLTLFVTLFVVHTVIGALGWLNDVPVVGRMNQIAGGVFGIGIGLVIVWGMLIGITFIDRTTLGKLCFENIHDSWVLTYLYENNILLDFIEKYR